jgi:predicted RNase H-like HicB family nuclease
MLDAAPSLLRCKRIWLYEPQLALTGEHSAMKTYTAVVERCSDTGLYVGYVPGFPGAHSQGESLDELKQNLQEVIEMLLEDGEPKLEGEFIGTQNIMVV